MYSITVPAYLSTPQQVRNSSSATLCSFLFSNRFWEQLCCSCLQFGTCWWRAVGSKKASESYCLKIKQTLLVSNRHLLPLAGVWSQVALLEPFLWLNRKLDGKQVLKVWNRAKSITGKCHLYQKQVIVGLSTGLGSSEEAKKLTIDFSFNNFYFLLSLFFVAEWDCRSTDTKHFPSRTPQKKVCKLMRTCASILWDL